MAAPAYISGSIAWKVWGSTGSTSTLTLSAYAVPAGTDKLLVVISHSEDSGIGDVAGGATFGGTAMTERARIQTNSDKNALVLYTHPLGATTPTGDIVVTSAGAGIRDWRIGAIVISGADQSAAPISATALGLTYNITTTSVDNLLITAYGSSSTGAITADPADTLIDTSIGGGDPTEAAVAYRVAATAQAYS
ncbi:MAG: hypothetical protein D6782_05890, partial [Alphaproteobacteria bacterium]